MREIRIRLLWHKQAQFAGYLLAEQLGLGERAGVRIICEGLDFSCKHVNAVLTGLTEMCVASPAHLVESSDPAALPQDLAAFVPWWLTEPLLDEGRSGGRIAPQGAAGAKLMVLVEEPEAEDSEALLSGPEGRLLDAMLAAFGLKREDAYLASVLPRHKPAPDWNILMQQGIGQVIVHHIGLAAPERLLVLGGNILPLIGHELPQRPAVLRQFNQEGRTIPMLASWGLPALMRQPRAKPVLWRTWLEWTAA